MSADPNSVSVADARAPSSESPGSAGGRDRGQPRTTEPTNVAAAAAPVTTATTRRGRAGAAAGRAAASWWVFTTRPMSLKAAWRLSGVVDARRIPGDARWLAWAWWWSNRLDRVLLFALAVLAPTVLTGPLLWCAARPARRWGLYLVVAGLVLLFVRAEG